MMRHPRKILQIESGRPLEVFDEFRQSYFESQKALAVFAKDIGAVNVFAFPWEKPKVFGFRRGGAPEGWLKQDSKGRSSPRKNNTAMIERIEALPWPETPAAIVAREFPLPQNMSYERPDGSRGSRGLSVEAFHPFSLAWSAKPDGKAGTMFLFIPDYDEALKGHEGDKITWHPEGTAPGIPDGCRVVSESEMDLIFAQDKVEREKYVGANTAMKELLQGETPSELWEGITEAMKLIGKRITVDIDSNDAGGHDLNVRWDGLPYAVHPALRDAILKVAPVLLSIEIEDYSASDSLSGYIWISGAEDVYLDASSDQNDWLYERNIAVSELEYHDFPVHKPFIIADPDIGMGWTHLFEEGDKVVDRAVRFVWNRDENELIHADIRRDNGWNRMRESEFESLKDSLVNANPEALTKPSEWNLCQSAGLPAWAQKAPEEIPQM